jgi:GNAT superfamily N-acetyltransferase
VPYEALTIYERWLHGGPWMSVETGALQLSHVLGGAGMPLVAELDGSLLAYAEAYHGVEPEPFGDHLHIATLSVHPEAREAGLQDALLRYLGEQAKTSKCKRLTATCVANDAPTQAFYARHHLTPLARFQRLALTARTGQGFYRVEEHLSANPNQIAGWFMPAGRFSSARAQWEMLWPRTWNALPEIRARRTHRLHMTASGQEALLCCQQQLYDPRSADVYLWSPKPLTGQLLTALRDWAHREGYRALVMLVHEDTVRTLGPDAEADGYYQETYGVEV